MLDMCKYNMASQQNSTSQSTLFIRLRGARYYKHGSHDPTIRAYKSKHMQKLNMSEYRHLQMKKAEKPEYLPDPAEGTRS